MLVFPRCAALARPADTRTVVLTDAQDIVGETLKTGTAKDVGDLVNGCALL